MRDLFFEDTPSFPGADYMQMGVNFALCSRVQELAKKEDQAAKEDIKQFTHKNFNTLLKGEEDKFWCDVQKRIALYADNFGPELQENYNN